MTSFLYFETSFELFTPFFPNRFHAVHWCSDSWCWNLLFEQFHFQNSFYLLILVSVYFLLIRWDNLAIHLFRPVMEANQLVLHWNCKETINFEKLTRKFYPCVSRLCFYQVQKYWNKPTRLYLACNCSKGFLFAIYGDLNGI